MRLLEFFPGFPLTNDGTYGSTKAPRGSGKTWQKAGSFPYTAPPAYPAEDDEEDAEPLIARFRAKIGRVTPRRDMGQTRVDVGNFLGSSGTFNALAEGEIAVMRNSIVPIVHFNRMTNRTQDLNDPMQIPNITSGPGVKHATGTPYGTRHGAISSLGLLRFNPAETELYDRDERGLISAQAAIKRFRDLHRRQYGEDSTSGSVIVSGQR